MTNTRSDSEPVDWRRIVGRNVARYREAAGLTQEALSEKAGKTSVKMIESGRTGASIDTLHRLGQALGVPLTDLLRHKSGQMHAALEKFLGSPLASDVTDEELDYLQGLHAPQGRAHTAQSYFFALQMFRATVILGS